MNGLFLWLGLSAGLAYSVSSALSKALLKNRIKEPVLLFLYINLIQALVTPLLWIFVKPQLPPLAGLAPLLASCVTSVAGYLCFYTALSCGDVSSVMPIMGSKVIFAGLLAIPLLHEKHNWQVYTAALLVAISISLLSYSPSHGGSSKFPLKPISLMTLGCVMFGFTDISFKRSLAYLDVYNFLSYYNFLAGVLSLSCIPYIRKKGVSLVSNATDLWLSFGAAASLLAATLLTVILFKLIGGVVIPNILISIRGIFIVLISAILTHHGSTMLETQSKKIYLLRLAASTLIVFSIWIALSHFPAAY